jgi:L-ascorbate metabolism protein UlaG (beta-lactamase superfamily)
MRAGDSISELEDGLVRGNARLTWLGHSTVLIELDGSRFLTDPVLRPRILHLRRRAPVAPKDLSVDAAVVSHVHWDHLDVPSLARLGRKSVRVVVPRGAGTMLRRRGFERVEEVAAGETIEVGGVAVRATHAEHEAYRWRKGASVPSIGYVFDGSRSVYFAGDTDLFEGMSGLVEGLDVALIPVAGWGPTLPPGHLDPRGAAKAVRRLAPRIAVPIHWGTYSPFGAAPATRAPEEFRTAAAEIAPEVEVRVLRVGETLTL